MTIKGVTSILHPVKYYAASVFGPLRVNDLQNNPDRLPTRGSCSFTDNL